MPTEKQELYQMLTFLSDIIDLLNPTHLILHKFYVQAWAKINIQGIEPRIPIPEDCCLSTKDNL